MDHGQLGGKALLVGPLVLVPLTDDALAVIGQDGNILRGGKGAQLGHKGGVQRFFHQRFAGAAVHDLAAVVGQDAAALFVQPQLLCQRQNARRGTAGGQHDGHALGSSCVQRCAGGGGDDLLVIGQGAVEVERQHTNIFLFHIQPHLFLQAGTSRPCRFYRILFYCTMNAPLSARLFVIFLRHLGVCLKIQTVVCGKKHVKIDISNYFS